MANLLDLFAIGFSSEGLREFETNLKNTERELDKAEKEVTSLEKKLADLEKAEKKDTRAIAEVKSALEQANGKVKQFGDSLKVMQGRSEYQLLNLKKNFGNLTKTLGMLATVGVAVKKSLDFYEQAEQLDFLAQKSGIVTEKLQVLGNAAKRYGGTTEGTAGTVENLRSQYQSLRMGQGGGGLEQAAFKYGVAISSDPEKMLENVAKRMETLKSDAAKWDLAKTLGIDEGTTRLLIQGVDTYRKELERANKYKLYTKEDIARMREYRQIQGDIRMGLESVFGTIWRGLLPALSSLAKKIRNIIDWLVEHKDITRMAAIIIGITTATLGLATGIKLVSAAFALLKLANPHLVAIGLLLSGIFLIIQDLVVFIQGGDSLIGRLWQKWGYDLEKIRAGFAIWIERIKTLWNNLLSFFDKNRAFQEDPLKIDTVKTQPLEKAKQIRQHQLKQENAELAASIANQEISISRSDRGIFSTWRTWSMAQGAKNHLAKYGSNKFNAIPAGALSNYNQTQAINENNTTNNIANSNKTQRIVNINEVNIQTQASDPRAIAGQVGALSDMDNGIL